MTAADRAAQARIGVIGLGYVGLPLTVAFGAQLPTLGYDIDHARVAELQQGRDHTLEMSADELAAAVQARCSQSSP
ncbi:UDP-N-acetyl-D-glucosamine 6-dehydrogenase [compost metagenome]